MYKNEVCKVINKIDDQQIFFLRNFVSKHFGKKKHELKNLIKIQEEKIRKKLR